MSDKLLAEFPETTYEQWREQVDKDLKGGDFQKRLVTRTLEGLEVRPLYTERDLSGAELSAYRRGAALVGRYGSRWDLRAELWVWDSGRSQKEVAEELARGASSLWLRFEQPQPPAAELAALLADVDLTRVPVVLDAGSEAPALAACYLSVAAQRDVPAALLQGGFGYDPLGLLARDGRAPYGLDVARALAVELARLVERRAPQLRSLVVDTTPYHDAGASGGLELAIALGTALTYLRWLIEAGFSPAQASAQLEFRVGVAGDLFAELAKLRALRVGYAKLIAALGGDDVSQHTRLHAVTARRTKTLRDPWVNMLRTTTEAFSAMAGGADSLTTRGFDEALGASDEFARRIARNVQVILNEEAHVTHVADPAGGSYYVEASTDALARDAWQRFQKIEAAGGVPAALQAGNLQREIAELAAKREQAIAKRAQPILGVSEFANLGEQALAREAQAKAAAKPSPQPSAAEAALAKLRAAAAGHKLEEAVAAFAQGAQPAQVIAALAEGSAPIRVDALPLRRHAAAFEKLRARADAHTPKPSGFLCNLGAIPEHKARAGFSTGFLNAGGIAALDNDGFPTPEAAAEAFASSGAKLAVICGSDAQYPEWVPKLAPLLAKAGALDILLAGRPGEQEAAYRAAGVTGFIFMGADVAAALGSLLDRLGVAP
ncbi:MAG TPA: methylmalonyl-CoA mutase family protein [Polyangiales bacterium]|nr:methylmalonyl-CoA mutase family protein [Polyangiales bacterium]